MDKTFNIDNYQFVLAADSKMAFLVRLEEQFKINSINRYVYIFLPAEASFNADITEINHFGFNESPNALQRLSKFLRSSHGAKRTKYVTAGLLKPFYSGSIDYKNHLQQTDSIIFPELDNVKLSLYVPVHAGASHTGLFILQGGKDIDWVITESRNVQILCQALHQRYSELWIRPDYHSLSFSTREREIINWMAKGKSNSVIGDIIGMSKHTVDAYLRTIYAKLSVSNRTSAAVKACELGLLQF